MRVAVEGTTVEYHEQGAGEPVVLLHGSGPGVSAMANWSRTLPAVAAMGYRAIAPDIVGFGASDKPANFPYHADGWARSLRDFLGSLGLDRAHLVGNSMGGRIALTAAARWPEMVSSLTVMGVRGPGDGPAYHNVGRVRAYEPSLDNMRRLLTGMFVVDASLVSEDVVRSRHEASTAPGAHEAYQRIFESPEANVLPLTDDDLRALRARTLVVHGREDRVIPVECAHHLTALIPDVTTVVVSGCGHWVQVEKADLFESLLRLFLGQQRRAAPR